VILVLATDLFFASRIGEVARTLGLTHASARDIDALLVRARQAPPRVVFVDLLLRDADSIAALRALRADPATSGSKIITFYPHVLDELGQAARDAGADLVLTRGPLSKQLPAVLATRP
jgi:CheY-like chemotaxis protein